MSSIGLIFRESRQLDTVPNDWIPEPLGVRSNVTEIVDGILRVVPLDSLALTVTVESEDENSDPRTISVSGVWGDDEMSVIRALCLALDAKFYDAEAADFVEL
ncbi:hypothetical protein ACWYXK_16200 [Janthinobacterium lividum]